MDIMPYWAPKKKLGGGWICFKDTPQAPVAPDPTTVSNAQTASNLATARANAQLNRVNQYTPWGSQTYSQTATPDKIDQAGYDNAMKQYNASLSQPQQQASAPVWESESGWSSDPAQATAAAKPLAMPNIADFTTKGNSDTWNSTINLDPAQQKLLDASNHASQSMADLGNNQIQNVANTINKPLDFSGLPQLQQGNLQTSAGVNPSFRSNAGYGNIQDDINTSNVGQYQNKAGYGKIQDGLDVSGVPSLAGGDALSNAMKQAQQAAFNQQKAYLDPQWNQQQHDLENKLVQQGIMQNSDAWNRAMDDQSRNRTFAYQNANDQSVAQGNAAQAQLYNQRLSSNQNAFNQAMGLGSFANAAQAQGFGQDLNNANLNNGVVNNQFSQAQALQAAHNASQAQGFGQDYQNATLANTVAQNQFNNGLQNAQLNNQAAGQGFAQSDTARNQGINELLQQQQNPLNVLNALRSGSQVTSPTFGAQPQVNVAGTDVMSPINNAFNAQMGQYNSQIASNNALTGALGSLGGYALGGPFGGALGKGLFSSGTPVSPI